jgi:hypothetical protein
MQAVFVHHSKFGAPMSALGQKQTSQKRESMSAKRK